jgi:hypothetical protein
VVFQGEHVRLLPLFSALRTAIEGRIRDVRWRALKYYVAAESEGSTFLAVKRRADSLVLGLTLPREMNPPSFADNRNEFNWTRMTKVTRIRSQDDISDDLVSVIEQAALHASNSSRSHRFHGVTLKDILAAELVVPGANLVLMKGSREITTATLSETGEIIFRGKAYQTPSHRDFAALMGRQSVNGWAHWFVEGPVGRSSLAEIRKEWEDSQRRSETG